MEASIDTIHGYASRLVKEIERVARTARPAFLAPDITKAIRSGLEPKGLTAEQLVRAPKLPADWNEQRSLLGFD